MRSYVLLCALLCLGLPACGGGGGGGAGIDGGGIGGTGLRIGPIESDGQVQVLGVTFASGGADVQVDGVASFTAALRRGMQAVVQGSVSGTTGTATVVRVEGEVKGPIASRPDANTLVILGQTIRLTPDTVYGPGVDPGTGAGLAINDTVEIHGWVRGSGEIEATRVEVEVTPSQWRISGVVDASGAGGTTITIGGMVVDISAADLSRVGGATPGVGTVVRVRAQVGLDGSGRLVAVRVDPRHPEDLDDDDLDDVEVEGIVSAMPAADRIVVAGIEIRLLPTTRYVGGTLAELVVGVKVEVEGRASAGTFEALEVEFEESVRLESTVASKGASSFTLTGFGSITIQVDGATDLDDVGGSLAGLGLGAPVRVRAVPLSGGGVRALRVDSRSDPTDRSIQGPVDASPAPSDPTFSILGILIDTTGLQDDDFEDLPAGQSGRAGFFAVVQPGGIVEVDGEDTGGGIVWDEVELEDD